MAHIASLAWLIQGTYINGMWAFRYQHYPYEDLHHLMGILLHCFTEKCDLREEHGRNSPQVNGDWNGHS